MQGYASSLSSRKVYYWITCKFRSIMH